MKRGAFIRSLIALPAISTIAAKLIQPTNGQSLQLLRFGEEINPGTIIEDMTLYDGWIMSPKEAELIQCWYGDYYEVVPDQLSKETEADGKLLRDGR